MKIYVAGKITGDQEYKEKFEKTAARLKDLGHDVMNPAILPDGFGYEEYMHICFAMIDICHGIYFISDWRSSPGAMREHQYAHAKEKYMFFEDSCTDLTRLT